MAKDAKKAKKGDAAGKQGGRAAREGEMSIAAHPRAMRAVARAKGAGGLLGLVLVGLLSWRAGAPPVDVGLRALSGGIVGYVAFWAIAVHAWRHVVVAEARAAGERLRRQALERAAATDADAAA